MLCLEVMVCHLRRAVLLFPELVPEKLDEVDVAVDEAEVEPALVDENDAGGKEKQPPDEGDGGGDPARVVAAVGDVEGDGEAGGDEERGGGVESGESLLDESGAYPLLGHLQVQERHPLVGKGELARQNPFHFPLQGIDPVEDPSQTRGRGEDQRPAGGDEDRGGDHGGEDPGA